MSRPTKFIIDSAIKNIHRSNGFILISKHDDDKMIDSTIANCTKIEVINLILNFIFIELEKSEIIQIINGMTDTLIEHYPEFQDDKELN